MKNMKLIGWLVPVALGAASCGAPAADAPVVAPGDGPKATAAAKTAAGSTAAPKPSKAAKAKVASFHDKYTYPDGVRVEVIRIKQAKIGPYASTDDPAKRGDPDQILSIRVTNGSAKKVDVSVANGTMTYGPDGDEAPFVSDTGVDSMSGTVLPGRAKTGKYAWAVPTKYLSDATLEFTVDFDHDAAIFTGSLK